MIGLLFVSALLLFFFGVALLFGWHKYIVRTDRDGIAMLSKKEIAAVAATFLFVGALVSITAGAALFSDNPYWLLDVVFGAFT
jgi:hypothetical protein